MEVMVAQAASPQEAIVFQTIPAARWRHFCQKFMAGLPPGLKPTPFDITEYNEGLQLGADLRSGLPEALIACLPALVTGHRVLKVLVIRADRGADTGALESLQALAARMRITGALNPGCLLSLKRGLQKVHYVLFRCEGADGFGASAGGLAPGQGAAGAGGGGGGARQAGALG